MRKVGYWSVWTPFVGSEAVSDLWVNEGQDELSRKTVEFGPVLLALAVCVVLLWSWFSFAGSGLSGLAEVVDDSGTSIVADALLASSSSVDRVGGAGVSFDSVPGLSGLFAPEVLFWQDKILEWSRVYSIDPNIIATIMQIESCGHPGAVSVAGARGLFQVMPFHFDTSEDMLDPDTNAMRGLLFFREQMRYTGEDIFLSFAGYNGGYAASGGSYQSWPYETQRYYYWAQGIFEDASSGSESSARLDEWLAAGGASGCRVAAQSLGL